MRWLLPILQGLIFTLAPIKALKDNQELNIMAVELVGEKTTQLDTQAETHRKRLNKTQKAVNETNVDVLLL